MGMKIIMINGSHRKNGATALILHEMYQKLQTYPNVEIQFYNVADLNMNYCIGCCKCYKNGKCIFNDDIEMLSQKIETADGIIIGSPTYASNVSGHVKVLIDRGHFAIEQLLFKKYAISVSTYENYGGKDTAKILNRLFCYSGATISNSLVIKTPFSSNPFSNPQIHNTLNKATDKLYKDIYKQKTYLYQKIRHFIIFRFGILPFVMKKGNEYQGVVTKWKKHNIKNGKII
ncbi:flavodoxin family protein [Petralouisia muris]|uniref:Flavodoxin family protein n=1 Tax=Petralouisia muris TaxID=3032872 RepID=A0AC61RR74_9FIRM|nr:flavodoxin family protein [Petralouisia muris]